MRRFPGFDAIRIAAAAGVVLSHSYLIAEGSEANEPFQKYTGEILGVYSVLVFFMLSGFLVTDSACRSKSCLQFGVKRFRRIAPGFIVNISVVTILICPLFAWTSGFEFLADPKTWVHFSRVLTFQDSGLYFWNIQFYPPSLGQEKSIPSVANGVLWTIRLEAACYVVVGLLMLLRVLGRFSAILVLFTASLVAFAYTLQINDFLAGIAFVLPSFAFGIALHVFAYEHSAQGRWATFSFAILILLVLWVPNWEQSLTVLFPMFMIYPLFWLGQRDGRALRWIKQFGDPSYGMYLWGWPVQHENAGGILHHVSGEIGLSQMG